jgi:YVTN family beta-propeller protein
MQHPPFRSAALALLLIAALAVLAGRGVEPAPPATDEPDRSPVDLVLTADEQFLLTANQSAGTVSLVRVADGRVTAEAPVGERPSAVALTPDGGTVLVSSVYGGDLAFLRRDGDRLTPLGRLKLGFEPRGIAVSPDGKLAYVALTSGHAIAVVDVAKRELLEKIPVGRWPRSLTLNPDGSRLAVGVSGDGGVAVIDTATRKQLFIEDFLGLNLGQMHPSRDGKYAYVPWMVYRQNAITANNIRIGWVLASRIARVRLDKQARREAISLDKQGEAVADPHGLALSPDEEWMVCAASGSHELLVYRVPGLPFMDYGGPGDHIDAALLKDSSRFYRIPLGGRPMTVRYSKDGKHVFVANALANAVQVVDVPGRKVERTISLGGPKEPSLARKGEAIFYDGKRSLDQWYSCHTCHYEGHGNAVTMDTRNDGRFGNYKTVLSLHNVTHTGPWFWHGVATEFDGALKKSLTDTMLGSEPTADDLKALRAYFEQLRPPPNPNRAADGSLSEVAKRGEAVFRNPTAGCAKCHSGPYFTDGEIHEVGTGDRGDVYKGYNTPSLVGVYDRLKYLHDGRAATLEQVLTGPHAPEKVTRKGKLSAEELRDLIEYLKAL